MPGGQIPTRTAQAETRKWGGGMRREDPLEVTVANRKKSDGKLPRNRLKGNAKERRGYLKRKTKEEKKPIQNGTK